MKIVSCFSRLDEIKPLSKAGADELYTGVKDIASWGEGTLATVGELKTAVSLAHEIGKKIALAVNSYELFLCKADCAKTAAKIARIDNFGIDAFIFANPAFLEMLSHYKIRLKAKLHLSSIQPSCNTATARFFINSGVSRIIFPCQLSAAEAMPQIALCKRENIETEIFDYRFFGCVYINGKCFLHRDKLYTSSGKSFQGRSLCRYGESNVKSVSFRAAPSAGANAAIAARSLSEIGFRGEILDSVAESKQREASILDGDCKPNIAKTQAGSRNCSRIGYVGQAPMSAARYKECFNSGGPYRLLNSGSFFDYFSAGVGFLKYGTRHDSAETKLAKLRATRSMLRLAEELAAAYPERKARELFVQEMSKMPAGGI